MASFDLFSLQDAFADYGVMICFSGPFSHSVIEELGTAVRKYFESNDAPQNCIADVFSVFIELAQNVKNYTSSVQFEAQELSQYRQGTLVIARKDDTYIVSSGNLVLQQDCEPLERRLNELRVLDKQGLKSLYKDRLRESPSERGGAGLGLVAMARKSAEPISYSIRRLPDGEAFFSVSVSIEAN